MFSRYIILLTLICIPGIFAQRVSQSSPLEKATVKNRVQFEQILRSRLFDHYDQKVRPTGRQNDTVSVYGSMMLLHIEGIDADRQVLKVHTWVGMRWNDPRLNWNSPDFGNITVIHTSEDDVWLPDLALYNNADGKNSHSLGQSPVIIQSNGDVLHIPPATFSAQCNMSFDDWPYDKHRCHLILGSWTQHGWQIDLKLDDSAVGIDIQNYVENDQWNLLKTSARVTQSEYPGLQEPYVTLSFFVTVERNPCNYKFTLVYPVNIMLLASCLLFIIPDFRFRLIIGLIQMLALCGESIFLWTIVPPTRGTPSIVKLVSISMVSIISALILCWLLDLISNIKRPAPNWLKNKLLPLFGPALCVTASRFWSPKKITLNRGNSTIEEDRDVLTVDYETDLNDPTGFPLQIAKEELPENTLSLEKSDNSWREFAALISRFVFVFYLIGILLIIFVRK